MFSSKETRRRIARLASGVATALALWIPATSQATTWDFRCSNGTTCAGNDSERTFTVNGVAVTVRAFETQNDNGTGAFQSTDLSQNGSGLGVGSNVDNDNENELIVFRFSTNNYIPVSVFLDSIDDGDTDIDIWVGGNALSFSNFTSLSYATLSANGFTSCGAANSGSDSDRTADFSSCNLAGKFLIVGADNSGSNDEFKIRNLTANGGPDRAPEGTVPEPSAMILFGIGLLGLRAFHGARAKKMQQLPVEAN